MSHDDNPHDMPLDSPLALSSVMSVKKQRSLVNRMLKAKNVERLNKKTCSPNEAFSALNVIKDDFMIWVGSRVDMAVIADSLGVYEGMIYNWLASDDELSERYNRVMSVRDLSEFGNLRAEVLSNRSILNMDEKNTAQLKMTTIESLGKSSQAPAGKRDKDGVLNLNVVIKAWTKDARKSSGAEDD